MTVNRFILVTASLLMCLFACGGSKGTDPGETDPTDPGEITPPTPVFQRYVKDQNCSSSILRAHVKYSVYLPAGYENDTEKRYSVVYMLHGLGDDNNSWNGSYLHANSKINEWEAKGLSEMIYVFPQGFNSYYCNAYNGSYAYMDMFVQELIPLIDKTYRTIPDRQHRAVTGYSMGGFGTIALAEKHPEMFIASAPLSMSVRTDWQYKEESQSGWENQWGWIFGGKGQSGDGRITEYYKQHCPLYYFNEENRESLSSVHWYLICGDDEKNLLYANDELHCVMAQNGYEHEWRVVNGGHSSSVWMPALDEVLPMFDHYMNGGTLWDPSYHTEITPGTVETDANSVFVSPVYQEKHTGTAMLIPYKGLSVSDLKAVMAAIQVSPSFDNGYVLLPCDLSKKDLSEWMFIWDGLYPSEKKLVLGIGEGAAQAASMPAGTFRRSYYAEAQTGEAPVVSKGQSIYFAGTDKCPYWWDLNALYNACKDKEAEFEYRVVNGTSDPLTNILLSIKVIQPYLYY